MPRLIDSTAHVRNRRYALACGLNINRGTAGLALAVFCFMMGWHARPIPSARSRSAAYKVEAYGRIAVGGYRADRRLERLPSLLRAHGRLVLLEIGRGDSLTRTAKRQRS
jgi:hypothetical protein